MTVGKVAYVTHEIAMMGLDINGAELPQMYLYSGGLGTLAGAIARAAKNLNTPMVVFSVLARYGYYDQSVYESEGALHMGVEFVRRDYADILEDTGAMVAVDICGKTNYVKVWKIPGKVYGTVDVYLLDSDIEENDYFGRMNTRYLYSGPTCVGGNFERQIAQDMIIGIGAVKAAEILGLDIDIWHMNESHTAPAGLYLLEKELPKYFSFMSTVPEKERVYREAVNRIKPHLRYTNHTPDPAGNARYGLDMFSKMYRGLSYDVLARIGDDFRSPPGFNMGAACLRLSSLANAVSKKHLEVTKAMFSNISDGCPIVSITNGSLLKDFFQDPMFTDARTSNEMLSAKARGKRALNEFLRGYGKQIDLNLPVIDWSRRFARYKRPDLLLKYSRDWLINALAQRRFTLIIAGKPHPDDHEMVIAWTKLLRLSAEYPNLILIPNYDMRISKILKVGSDMWLNTPIVGMEACGTSGQSAAANGSINVSTIDGWMCEADVNNYFPFGTQYAGQNIDTYDANDRKKGLTTVLDRALHLYTYHKSDWFCIALHAKLEAERKWNAERMMQEYVDLMYQL